MGLNLVFNTKERMQIEGVLITRCWWEYFDPRWRKWQETREDYI